ncbi:MAG TPA: hypothetical protein VFE52_09535 [Devosia sp.]|nr:hypothetical protein [Devosia sp.]
MTHRLLTPAIVGLIALAGLGAAPAAAADFTAFRAACASGGAFLIGEVPEGKNVQPVLDALCPCLETGFAEFTQPEIDALAADLRTGDSAEAEAMYPAYAELKDKATPILGACFASEAVMAAARAEGL